MKLPGEAWLEFRIETHDHSRATLVQTATFRPAGIGGRLYWWVVSPAHALVFPRTAKGIVKYGASAKFHERT